MLQYQNEQRTFRACQVEFPQCMNTEPPHAAMRSEYFAWRLPTPSAQTILCTAACNTASAQGLCITTESWL